MIDDNQNGTKNPSSAMKEESQTTRLDSDDENDKDNEAEAERILRGSRVPGMWHCYTAVFDGKNCSTLRIDGVEEILSHDGGNVPMPVSATCHSDQQNRRNRKGPRAMLDGLTMGSDHCFDMTLCFGDGSGGEGEGAIAEIAVFSGRLDRADLETLESQLMAKHGIPRPGLSREDLVQEDDWTRKATALYCQTPAESAAYHIRHGSSATFGEDSVPLRIMTKHRSVAWHQFSPVTGEELRIKRIGSRSAGSSSDW